VRKHVYCSLLDTHAADSCRAPRKRRLVTEISESATVVAENGDNYILKADVRHATKLSNFVAQLYGATSLPRQLSIFHWQTIAQQTWLLVTQTTT